MVDFNDFNNAITNQIGIIDIARQNLARNDLSDNDKSSWEMVMEYALDTIDIFKKFSNEFTENKNKKGKYDDKKEQFDKLFSEINQLMIQNNLIYKYEKCCEDDFINIWDRLNSNSRTYIITASYLFNSLSRIKLDFSPAILEICRSFENELKTKIFDSENNDEFISLDNMLRIIHRKKYQPLLKQQLLENKWDIEKLSSKSFYKDSKRYKDDYRNESAHANKRIMNDVEWNKCTGLTKKLLIDFFKCQDIT